MAFKWYHGKTGVVWNVTKRAVGVEVNKTVSKWQHCCMQSWGRGPGRERRDTMAAYSSCTCCCTRSCDHRFHAADATSQLQVPKPHTASAAVGLQALVQAAAGSAAAVAADQTRSDPSEQPVSTSSKAAANEQQSTWRYSLLARTPQTQGPLCHTATARPARSSNQQPAPGLLELGRDWLLLQPHTCCVLCWAQLQGCCCSSFGPLGPCCWQCLSSSCPCW